MLTSIVHGFKTDTKVDLFTNAVMVLDQEDRVPLAVT